MKRAVAIAFLLLLIAPTVSLAACPRTSLAAVEKEVMCPVCGVPLGLATEAPQAQRERAFILREVERCKSKQEIKDELVAQFGERVLALPPERGFNLAVYIVPVAIILLGIGAIGTMAVRWRRRGPGPAAPARPGLAGEDAARLHADLERYDL